MAGAFESSARFFVFFSFCACCCAVQPTDSPAFISDAFSILLLDIYLQHTHRYQSIFYARQFQQFQLLMEEHVLYVVLLHRHVA